MLKEAVKIVVKGTVQGVGFRPFIYRIAREMGYTGNVKNTPSGVEIHLEPVDSAEKFVYRIKNEAPANVRIDFIDVKEEQFQGFDDFSIEITEQGASTVFTPPDLFTCTECLKELFSENDRRFRYPFINCTLCGPRYTIVHGLPYDRIKTTMKYFDMCPACEKEYNDPSSRRFHAQPNACPECGPSLYLVEKGIRKEGGFDRAVQMIMQGMVVSVKGIGGFHLMCDALNPAAVARLRSLKSRERKPFALMANDINTAETIAYVNEFEKKLMLFSSRPIVLCRKKKEIHGISPGLNTFGIMLPYTPLHALIMEKIPLVVATSGNDRESPIMKHEDEGINEIADAVLAHDREIAVRCDDSVIRACGQIPVFLRRARGFVPEPVEIHFPCKSMILSLGGELKNTITVLKDNYLITSQYLGDMKDARNRSYLEEMIKHYRSLYDFSPDIVTCDLHPDFTTTRMARSMGIPVLQIQHHEAHIFAVMAEHGLYGAEPMLGVSFDGVGYGSDGKIWGGEFFLMANSIERIFHFRYVPQQGGDLAVKQPWRMALGFMMDSIRRPLMKGSISEIDGRMVRHAQTAIEKHINSPLTSSAGRLFDAVSALTGIAPSVIDFEAEAAIRLEDASEEDISDNYPFCVRDDEIDMRETINAMLADEEPVSAVAGKFHNTLARVIIEVASLCKEKHGIRKVILSGGVFQNVLLLKKTVAEIEKSGMEAVLPKKFSPGDEAISLGQAYYAAVKMNGGM